MINITEKEFERLSKFIKENYGIRLGKEKKSLVVGRLHNVLLQKNMNTFSEYFDYVMADTTGHALETLIEKISTNHTFFMREADHFEYFKESVLPYFSSIIKDKDLRIWCAGCSSGEEPYTLAMIINDFFGKDKAAWNTKLLATDISNRVLDIAKAGEYLNENIANLSNSWKLIYFKKLDNQSSVVTDKIKDEVIFRKFNLMENKFPFKKKFHAIFCRNVMIYFDDKTRYELVDKFYEALEPGGFLFIGHSESLNKEGVKFKYIMPAVYRKI